MTTYDFTGKRVRRNGKVLDKCSIAMSIRTPYCHPVSIYWDNYSYVECAAALYDNLTGEYAHLHKDVEVVKPIIAL